MSSPESRTKSGAELGARQRCPLHVRRRVLDAGDVGVGVAQAGDGVDGEVDHRAARHRIEDDRQRGGLGHGGEVLEQPLLGRLVVVGHDRQHRVGADLLGEAGRASTASSVELEPAPAMTGTRSSATSTADLDDAAVLVVGHGRALAGGADGHQAVRALFDLPVRRRREALSRPRPRLQERSDERRDRAS